MLISYLQGINNIKDIFLVMIFLIGFMVFVFAENSKSIIRYFIVLIAFLLTAGGVIALLAALIKLVYDVSSSMETDIEHFELVFIKLINLAEYLLVGITFFSIAKRLMVEPYFKLEDQADEQTDIPDLEKHIIGMVIATVSVAFIGLVVSSIGSEASSRVLIYGVGIGIFITSLGLYIKLSYSHKTIDILQQEIMQIHTRENESLQEITQLKSEMKGIISNFGKLIELLKRKI
jgi:hypothetical protein